MTPRFRGECDIAGCSKIEYAHGWCSAHYARADRHGGDPLGSGRADPRPRTVPATHKETLRLLALRRPEGWPGARLCGWCSRPIDPTKNARTRFCSRDCATLDREARCGVCIFCLREPALWHSDICATCKQEHVRARGRRDRQVRRARKARVLTEWIDFAEVCRRDKWRCGICHRKVSQKLRHPDAMSATIDHVIPISQGGPNVMENVQLAHFHCNSLKRDRGFGQMSLLSPAVSDDWTPRLHPARAASRVRDDEIRAKFAAGGITKMSLATEYGISRVTVRSIINGPSKRRSVSSERDDVIRMRYATEAVSQRELGALYGISQAVVSRIILSASPIALPNVV